MEKFFPFFISETYTNSLCVCQYRYIFYKNIIKDAQEKMKNDLYLEILASRLV